MCHLLHFFFAHIHLYADTACRFTGLAALIENSLQAIENGTQIADDTAQSLIQAVNDVNEMAGIIEQISEAST